jgi:hypothetical protein
VSLDWYFPTFRRNILTYLSRVRDILTEWHGAVCQNTGSSAAPCGDVGYMYGLIYDGAVETSRMLQRLLSKLNELHLTPCCTWLMDMFLLSPPCLGLSIAIRLISSVIGFVLSVMTKCCLALHGERCWVQFKCWACCIQRSKFCHLLGLVQRILLNLLT